MSDLGHRVSEQVAYECSNCGHIWIPVGGRVLFEEHDPEMPLGWATIPCPKGCVSTRPMRRTDGEAFFAAFKLTKEPA